MNRILWIPLVGCLLGTGGLSADDRALPGPQEPKKTANTPTGLAAVPDWLIRFDAARTAGNEADLRKLDGELKKIVAAAVKSTRSDRASLVEIPGGRVHVDTRARSVGTHLSRNNESNVKASKGGGQPVSVRTDQETRKALFRNAFRIRPLYGQTDGASLALKRAYVEELLELR